MKKSMLLLAGMVIVISCSKDTTTNQNQPGETDFGNLTIAESFNWSSSIKGNTTVKLTHDSKLDTEGQQVLVIAEDGKRLAQSIVSNDQASFNITLPQFGAKYYLYYPRTGDSKEITNTGNLSFQLYADHINDIDIIEGRPVFGDGKKSTQGTVSVTGTNLLGNADFEINSFLSYNVSSYASVADNGQWYKWDNNYTWSTESGSKVYKAKNNKTSWFAQIVSVTPGDSFKISADGDKSAKIYLDWYNGNSYVGYDSYTESGDKVSGKGVVPNNITYVEIWGYVKNKAWLDNVHFESEPAIIDADNDGVADSNDDYPNDPARAYQTSFPTSGYQTLAFEDLWPAQGDFDFNDMVISTQIIYSSDANGDIVDAQVTISLDAMGAGASSGLAIRLLDASKQNFPGNIIASLNGDAALDPDVQNGIIVYDDVKAAQSEYYTNNGSGPSKDADEFTFTITFNSGVQSITPDIYIYRTGERGRETHIDGFTGTSEADATLANTKMDVNGTYNSASGLPWAIEVVTTDKSFEHPLEKVDVLQAYPTFQSWAQSSGSSSTNWMTAPANGKIFKKN